MIITDLHYKWTSRRSSPNSERYMVAGISHLSYNTANPDIISDWRMVYHKVANWIDATGSIAITVTKYSHLGITLQRVDGFFKTRKAARDFCRKWRDLPYQSRYFNNRMWNNPHVVWAELDIFSGNNDFFPYKVSGITEDILTYEHFKGLFMYYRGGALFTIETDAIFAKLMFG